MNRLSEFWLCSKKRNKASKLICSQEGKLRLPHLLVQCQQFSTLKKKVVLIFLTFEKVLPPVLNLCFSLIENEKSPDRRNPVTFGA